MQELIERLEAATRPDRGLDEAIAVALRMPRAAFGEIFDQPGMVDGPEYHADAGLWSGNGMSWRAPDFTSSIDVALTLLPEGWEWQSSNRAPKPHAGRAYIHNRELVYAGMFAAPNPKRRYVEVTAATPAIAMCIAALKAKSSAHVGREQK